MLDVDDFKAPDEIRVSAISVYLNAGSFGYCSFYVRGDNMKRLMK